MAFLSHDTNQLSQRVIGAAIEVHRHLGPGLLESSYQAYLRRELEIRDLGYRSQHQVPLDYKGVRLGEPYMLDLIVEDRVIVEVKAVEALLPVHAAQLLTYMRLYGAHAGLLINFNVPVLVRGVRRLLL